MRTILASVTRGFVSVLSGDERESDIYRKRPCDGCVTLGSTLSRVQARSVTCMHK